MSETVSEPEQQDTGTADPDDHQEGPPEPPEPLPPPDGFEPA
ncbi:hypothetical protein [Nonomuraea sp. NPDC048826]